MSMTSPSNPSTDLRTDLQTYSHVRQISSFLTLSHSSSSLLKTDDFSRVTLCEIPGEESSDYINACTIDVCQSIACV